MYSKKMLHTAFYENMNFNIGLHGTTFGLPLESLVHNEMTTARGRKNKNEPNHIKVWHIAVRVTPMTQPVWLVSRSIPHSPNTGYTVQGSDVQCTLNFAYSSLYSVCK